MESNTGHSDNASNMNDFYDETPKSPVPDFECQSEFLKNLRKQEKPPQTQPFIPPNPSMGQNPSNFPGMPSQAPNMQQNMPGLAPGAPNLGQNVPNMSQANFQPNFGHSPYNQPQQPVDLQEIKQAFDVLNSQIPNFGNNPMLQKAFQVIAMSQQMQSQFGHNQMPSFGNDMAPQPQNDPAQNPMSMATSEPQRFPTDPDEGLKNVLNDTMSNINDLSMQMETEEGPKSYSTEPTQQMKSPTQYDTSEDQTWKPQTQFQPQQQPQQNFPSFGAQGPNTGFAPQPAAPDLMSMMNLQALLSQNMAPGAGQAAQAPQAQPGQFQAQPNSQFLNQLLGQQVPQAQPQPPQNLQQQVPNQNFQNMQNFQPTQAPQSMQEENPYLKYVQNQQMKPQGASTQPMAQFANQNFSQPPQAQPEMPTMEKVAPSQQMSPAKNEDGGKLDDVLQFDFTKKQKSPGKFGSSERQPRGQEEVKENQVNNFDETPLPALQNRLMDEDRPIKPASNVNPHDEKPVGGGNQPNFNDFDNENDAPIQPKASNFEELLQQELENNPDAVKEGASSRKPTRQKQFLKRKKPVTAPPKNTKAPKYKYYAENFTEEPFQEPERQAEPKPKAKSRPFANTQERKEACDSGAPKPPSKPMAKKNFLVRGGGIGGGIGAKSGKDSAREEPPTKQPQKSERRKSTNRDPKQNKGKRRIFAQDSDEESDNPNTEEERTSSQNSETDSKPAPKPRNQRTQNKNKNEEKALAASFEPDIDEEELEIEHTEIPEHLLEKLPEKARDAIEQKLRELDFGIAKWGKLYTHNSSIRKDLQESLNVLNSEMEQFEFDSQQEFLDLKNYEEDEMKKVRRERKEFEKAQKDKKNTNGNNRGKQEIDELKERIGELNDEIKARDRKNKGIVDQMKEELEYFNKENMQIQGEIRKMEKERISSMNAKRSQAKGSQKKQAKAFQPRVVSHFDEFSENTNQPLYANPGSRVVNEPSPRSESEPSNNSRNSDNDSDSEEEYIMVFPQKYHSNTSPLVSETVNNNGKIQKMYENGKKELIFNNGVKKQIFPDGYTIVYFTNKDVKQTYPDGKGVYYFSEANTTQTTYTNGLKVFRFGNGQIEKHYPDETKEILFTDGTVKCIFADGEEESVFPDGTIQRVDRNGVKTIETPDGAQKSYQM